MGASQQGSQTEKSKYADDTLRPVTIKQLVDCKEEYPGAEMKIDGHPITQVTLVGQVRSVQPQATNITYRIDDGTGVTDVKKWIDAEKPNDSDPKYQPDTYVRVYGRLTTFNNKKHIGAHFIRAIEDFNEVNYHLLEATYVHLFLTRGAPGQGGGHAAAKHSGGDEMFVDGGDGGGSAANARLVRCSKQAQTVHNFLANSPGGSEGINLHDIAAGTKLTTNQVLKAADELLGNGLVYTTMDDETWAILDY